MPEFSDFEFMSTTARNTIHARKCVPDGTPRAVVQIVHGIAEHIERYDDFMSFLAANGIVAVGDDHLGHGKSVTDPADLGFFNDSMGWDNVVMDEERLHDIMAKEYPDIPYIFFGHSMGSFITRTFIIRHPDKYDAVIISGTGHQSRLMVIAGYLLAEAEVKAKGARGDGKPLNDIAFGSYLKKIEAPRTEFDWLSRDNETVDKYIADPMCGFIAKTSLYRDMMGGIWFVTNQKNINMMDKEKPVYFMSGADDPVGEYGKGVEKAYNAFCKAGLHDVKMKLYPSGRHEMLNETNRAEVYNDILGWINEKLSATEKA